MIVEVVEKTETKVSHWDIVKAYPLNPLRWAMWSIEELLDGTHRPIERYRYTDMESRHEVVGIKSVGLEKWD